MLPPMMPLLHDAFWLVLLAGAALFAWKAVGRRDLSLAGLRPAGLDLRRPFGRAAEAVAAAPTTTWFTPTATRSSGNSAFDEWRDGEIARIETQREALEARLRDFQAFVEKLKRAKDRETFERFLAEGNDASAVTSIES